MVKNEINMRIEIFRSDSGNKYLSKIFKQFCQHGIHHQHTQPHTLPQNGITKRMNRSLLEKTKNLMLEANVSNKLWIEVNITTYFYNFSPIRSNPCNTPKKNYFGKKVDLSYLHIFGSKVFVCLVKEDRNKLEPKSHEGFQVRYDHVSWL
jgi:hypothetical protein